jgi:hypothetical protein
VKKILVFAVLFLTLACQTVVGTPTSAPVAPPTASPQFSLPTAVPTETQAPPPTDTPTPAPVSGFEQIRLRSRNGDLNVQLEEQARFAEAMRLMPVVEFDASW